MKTLLSTIPALARVLSGGRIRRRCVLTLKLWYFVLTRKYVTGPRSMLITASYNGVEIPMMLEYPMDIAVLREIYLDKEYAWCPVDSPKVIVDLGAHFGDTALYYHARFPDARIIAVEPAPESFARLEENTKHIPHITCVQAVVSDQDGACRLHITESSLGNSLVERGSTVESVVVPSMTLATLCKSYAIDSIDLLKFDVEGAEFSIFRNGCPVGVRACIGEVHLDLQPGKTIPEFQGFFPGRGSEIKEVLPGKRYVIMVH